MDRLQKKCLVGSLSLHGFLLLTMLVGSAFFIQQERSVEQPKIRVVPGILIDQALAGGGGNPNVAKTDDQQKGETLQPKPKPAVVEPKPPVQPKPQRVVEPPPSQPEKPKVVKDTPPPKETAKSSDIKALDLKPVTRSKVDPQKEAAAADAKRRKEMADKIAKQLTGVEDSVRAGFKGGTKMEVWGPGGEAYAGYEAFVKAVYDDAWETAHLMDYDGAVKVSVTIRRTGDVISSYIVRGSGTSVVDKSVQRALDRVKFVAPFPKDAKDEQRTFNITFDLKAKKSLG